MQRLCKEYTLLLKDDQGILLSEHAGYKNSMFNEVAFVVFFFLRIAYSVYNMLRFVWILLESHNCGYFLNRGAWGQGGGGHFLFFTLYLLYSLNF